jgi:hypothetical protein
MVIVATSIECAFSLARVSSASLINFRAGGLRCREGAYGVEPRKWSSEKIAFGKNHDPGDAPVCRGGTIKLS